MRRALISFLSAAAWLAMVPHAGAGGTSHPLLSEAESFVLGIGNGVLGGGVDRVAERLGDYDVVVVDGQEATTKEVAALILEDGRLDGWNREDVTWTYDFQRRKYTKSSDRRRHDALSDLAAMRLRGIFTTATNYTRRSVGSAVDESIRDACEVNAVPFIGDIGLTAKRLPDAPYVCP